MNATEFHLSLPFCKVDTEKRTVEGYATTDSIDKQNEQVDYDASKEAFSSWAGNVREMHEASAVGKAIEVRHDDEKRGVYVKAYISKGAEPTWQKIKDGVLTSFSIGGQTVNKIQQIVKDATTNTQRHITRITKYKLTELSLVDNPANPDATFTLVKMENGVPTQTELVEDIKKVLISEAGDILEDEVKEHRDKADSLVKKVLGAEDLEKLDSEYWGVIRKFERDGKQFIERFLPMPDKVHAVRALAVVDKYNLSTEEEERVHKLAKSVLGADYDFHCSNSNRGGEIRKMNKEILDAVKSLTDRMDKIEARFAKANMDAPGDVKTQEEGEVAPKAKVDSDAGGKFEGEVPAEGAKQKLSDVSAKDGGEQPVSTQEEGNVAPKKKDDKDAGGEFEGKVPAEGAKGALPDVGAAAGHPKAITQVEGNVAPVHKVEGKKSLAPEGKADEIKKLAEESSLREEIKSLRKRLDAVESVPLPRKYKVEKSFGPPASAPADTLAEDMQKCIELRKEEQAGRKLTPQELALIEKTLKKSFDSKFDKSL